MEKAREFQKNIYFCFIDYAKAFDCVDHNKLWKNLKEMGINLPSRTSDSRQRIAPLLNSQMTQWKLEFGKLIIPHKR